MNLKIGKMSARAIAIHGYKMSRERRANLEIKSECPALVGTDSSFRPNKQATPNSAVLTCTRAYHVYNSKKHQLTYYNFIEKVQNVIVVQFHALMN